MLVEAVFVVALLTDEIGISNTSALDFLEIDFLEVIFFDDADDADTDSFDTDCLDVERGIARGEKSKNTKSIELKRQVTARA